MTAPQPTVESRVRVRYCETDQMGIAHHGSSIAWFEIGRTDLCRAAGLTYREIEELGYLLVVTDVSCRFRTPFRYDDVVVIRTRIESMGSRAIRFAYELYDEAGAVLHGEGTSAHLWLDRATRTPVKPRVDVARFFLPFAPK